MELLISLQNDIKEALKSGDSFKVTALRQIQAALQNAQIEKGKDQEMSEEDVIAILRKEAKKRKESVDIYKEAGRQELADKEQQELDLIKGYLPAEMPDEEIQKIVDEVLASGEEHMGKVIGQVMGRVGGRAEASRVSAIVKESLDKK